MGCSSAKQTLDDAIHELQGNPGTGLVSLRTALAQVGHGSPQQERVKAKVPLIFELLPKAMDGVAGYSLWPVLAACDVIVRCVTLCADPSIGGAQVVITGGVIKRCQTRLVALLKKSMTLGNQCQRIDARKQWECESSQTMEVRECKVTKAVVLAMIALLMLEAHATEGKQKPASPVASAGVAAALEGMHPENSGAAMKTNESIALMLSLFADTPKITEVAIAHGWHLCAFALIANHRNANHRNGTFALTSNAAETKTRDVSKDLHTRGLSGMLSFLIA